jgi:L-alanine-DL-glutamate epimerase-like enolase superfamily enzyme
LSVRITDLQAVRLRPGHTAIIRIDTDEGIYGYGEAAWGLKGPVPRDFILALKPYLVGLDPTSVENVMMRIRHMGGPAHLGVAVGAVSMALWDIAGKAAGLPCHRLLGGKVRDRVRVYVDSAAGIQLDPEDPMSCYTPEAYAEKARRRKALPEGYTVMKFDIGFHGRHFMDMPSAIYEESDAYPYQGHATERGIDSEIAIVDALKRELGPDIGLALDAGPGQTLPAAQTLCRELEPYNLMWVEDLFEGADMPYIDPAAYKILSDSTTTPILAGEAVYLRRGFRDLIDRHAVDVVAPDIQDVGGIDEAKRVAELADLYGVLVAPHNAQGAISLMANVHLGAVVPRNFLCFEFHAADSDWWEDAIVGPPKPLMRDGFAAVPDTPGLGFELNHDVVCAHRMPGEPYFQ